jgi:hypothetical protein
VIDILGKDLSDWENFWIVLHCSPIPHWGFWAISLWQYRSRCRFPLIYFVLLLNCTSKRTTRVKYKNCRKRIWNRSKEKSFASHKNLVHPCPKWILTAYGWVDKCVRAIGWRRSRQSKDFNFTQDTEHLAMFWNNRKADKDNSHLLHKLQWIISMQGGKQMNFMKYNNLDISRQRINKFKNQFSILMIYSIKSSTFMTPNRSNRLLAPYCYHLGFDRHPPFVRLRNLRGFCEYFTFPLFISFISFISFFSFISVFFSVSS